MAQDEHTIRTGLELACWSIAIAGCGLLALACAAELLRRRSTSCAFVALSDRLLPTSTHRVAVVVVTCLSSFLAFTAPRAALADVHVRDWLTGPTTSTTLPTGLPIPPTHERDPVDAERAPKDSSVRNWLTTPKTAPAPSVTTTSTLPAAPSPPRPNEGAPTIPAPSGPTPPAAPAGGATIDEGTDASASIYAVEPGDCLWSIAARQLGPVATNRAIDRGWRAIYAANRTAIGSDPNLILAGLVLTLPPLDTTP
jgi:hypothetical protein